LRDWRRINVSFTRAKKKLVIFGSAQTLAGDKMLKGFLDLMDSQGWIMRLKMDADKIHADLEGGVVVKEEPDLKPVKREGKLGDRILNGRPFLAEALGVSPILLFVAIS
jgi:DNA replication ATP-dependent helicase Dna2